MIFLSHLDTETKPRAIMTWKKNASLHTHVVAKTQPRDVIPKGAILTISLRRFYLTSKPRMALNGSLVDFKGSFFIK